LDEKKHPMVEFNQGLWRLMSIVESSGDYNKTQFSRRKSLLVQKLRPLAINVNIQFQEAC
jgi:hypothetical protein